jgi:hypothetical protein
MTTRKPPDHGRSSGPVAQNGGWVRVSNAVLHNPMITAGALRCLLVLRSHCIDKTVCWPGEETLAAELRCSLSTVGRRVAELERHELIRVKRRGLGKTNVYTLLEEFAPSAAGRDQHADRGSRTPDQERSQATDLSISVPSELVVYDPSNLTERSRGSSEVEEAPSGGASSAARHPTTGQELATYYVKEFRTRLADEPPKTAIGQVGKEAKKLLDDGCNPRTIRRAIQILVEKGLNPSTMSRLYLQAASERGTGTRRMSLHELIEPDGYFDDPSSGNLCE